MAGGQKTATVFGGSGFVGRYITRRLAKAGWRVRVAVRRPNEALFVRTYGAVGQVEPVLANIRDDESTKAAIVGSDVVVNCVGVLHETKRQSFTAVHADGAARIAKYANACGVGTLVHLSAIGADTASNSAYGRSKAAGEAAVLAAHSNVIILRPSVIFGAEDQFFNRFARLASLSLVVPLVGAESRFQPVFVDDVAKVAAQAAFGRVTAGTYELGGPTTASFRDLMIEMLRVVRRRRLLAGLPFWMAHADAWFLDMGAKLTLGLVTNKILTRDQVRQLRNDNLVANDAKSFSDLGIIPTPMELVLESYLYCYRSGGQYAAIKDSAKNLRSQE